MDRLRDEILQAQGVRSDLQKWKLGLVGAIGASGLGFAGSVELRHADLVLCTIPPVAVYVDLLCLHLTLRIIVIGSFLQLPMPAGDSAASYRAYEDFADAARKLPELDTRRRMRRRRFENAFALEDWALVYSTYAVSVAIAVYGVYQLWRDSGWFGALFVISGAVGLAGALIGRHEYEDRCRKVDKLRRQRSRRIDGA